MSGEGKIARFSRTVLPPFMLRALVMAMYAHSLLTVPMLIVVLSSALRIIPHEWSCATVFEDSGLIGDIEKCDILYLSQGAGCQRS